MRGVLLLRNCNDNNIQGQSAGQAILEAKQAHAQGRPNDPGVILGWNLLADPGLTVAQ